MDKLGSIAQKCNPQKKRKTYLCAPQEKRLVDSRFVGGRKVRTP